MSFNEWKTVKLEDTVYILGDGLHGTPKYDENGEYYFINGNNLDGNIVIDEKTNKVGFKEYEKFKKDLNDRTIFVSINGTLGRVATYNGEKVVLGKSACYFNVKHDHSKNYIKYIMHSADFRRYLNTHSTGTTIKNMGLKQMREFTFQLPPLEEQKAIAHVLSTLDGKIEVNNQINKILENMAQTIFKQWFVDFEFPNEDGEPYKSNGGEMVESELGMIPKGWKVKSVYELVDSISVKHSFPNDKIVFLNTSDVYDGEVLLHKETIVQNLPGQAKKSIRKHDILYSEIRPKNKRFAYINFDSDNYVVSTKLMVLRVKHISSAIVFFLLTCEATINELQMMAESRSGTFPQITFDNMKYIKIALPIEEPFPDDISNNFEGIINMISEKRKENAKLRTIRDSILPKLMSGEIRVPIDSEGGG
ncbi:restriction endonuclease subunit S [Trichococcus collinsii]|uniref:Type I restriction enzyme, S subunit n=1 Tax=Trichococcus collinsii TaxID=157076 RepID=A0AB37ZWR4_9LACT|nr:restriction endonuclease subunit S [Trichococcus collinsii]CZQ82340.1 restriction endonuclease type i hsds [Trichococcus collinsii]SDZ87554.1 type I restriction enzyme, S subunit [Trichococcus collinsii]